MSMQDDLLPCGPTDFSFPPADSVVLLTELLKSGSATGEVMQRSRCCNCFFGRPVKESLKKPMQRIAPASERCGTIYRRDARIGCTKPGTFMTKWRRQSSQKSREPDSPSSYISKNIEAFPEMVHTLY